jgi:DNA polymerase-3 subunit alpha
LRIPDLGAPVKPGTYTIIGMLKSLRTHIDSKSREMAFGTIQDLRGEIDLVFFARTWESCKVLVKLGETLALKGNIDPPRDKNPGKTSFVVSEIHDLNNLVREAEKKAAEFSAESEFFYRDIHIRLNSHATENEAALCSLRDFLEGNPGACPVYIHVPVSQEEISSGRTSPEAVIRSSNRISAGVSASIDAFEKYAVVADVWDAR